MLAEIILIISSVFIFRGLWHLMDKVEFMDSVEFLWFSVIIGIVITIFTFHYLKGKNKN